jgi:type IV pilus assembly protein PilM
MTRTVVGLDIGSSGVRAVELRPGRRPALRRTASVDLPEGVVKAGVLADAGALTEALGELWQQGRFGSRSVALGLANDGVLVRQMDLEWMPPADFRKALRYQVADALPVPVDEANLDYHLLDEIETGEPGTEDARKLARVMLVAAGREMVDGYVHAVQDAGLRVVRADLVPFALVRAATAVRQSSGTEVVVDVGADLITVVLVRDGAPRSVRMISGTGGADVTRALQERYDWTWEEAERTKKVLGIVSDEETAAQAGHPARAVVAEAAAALVAEIRTTVEFFAGPAEGEQSFSRLLLTGRGSLLRGLDALLADELGVEVTAGAPLDGRRSRGLDTAGWATYAVATGLCLGVR